MPPRLTIQDAIRLWLYNHIKRRWHNWRIKQMWVADQNRPVVMPRMGPISHGTYRRMKEIAENADRKRMAGTG